MTNPQEASEIIEHHFDSVSHEGFRERLERTAPEVPASQQLAVFDTADARLDDPVILHPTTAHVPLDAYLASALTGLTHEQRQLVYQLSDQVAQVCSDVGIRLYEPRKKTDPVHHKEVPADEVFHIDRERVIGSDLVIHLTHFPSTGAGEELDFAFNALVPIVLVSHSDTRVSRMVTGIPSFKREVTYAEPEELRLELREQLIQMRPFLVERKLAFSEFDAVIVGQRIRELREARGLTREELAQQMGEYLSAGGLKQLEEQTDKIANPSLVQLRMLATVLSTTVADLVEPDLDERLLAMLQEWVTGQSRAARFQHLTAADRNSMIRRILYRILDSLEEDDGLQ